MSRKVYLPGNLIFLFVLFFAVVFGGCFCGVLLCVIFVGFGDGGVVVVLWVVFFPL